MINNDQIILAYQLLMGREPESQEAINNLAQTVHSVEQLREVFMQSAEFKQRMGSFLDKPQKTPHRHPFHLPSIPVEVTVTDEQLDQMFKRIHQEWEHLGKTDPFWSVVTQPHYHLDQFEEHRHQFYSSGKHISDIFLASLRRNKINHHELPICLELGCGVGRVTGFLAEEFYKVIAVDISEHHLNHARQHLAELVIHNVSLVHVNQITQLLSLGKIDAILSVITFQHNPPPVMAWMLRHLLGSLNPKGVAYLQIPTYRAGYLFEAERYLHSEQPNTLEMHFLPQADIFKIIKECDCICLEVREDGMTGDEGKMLSNTFLIQKNI